jgi:hypothetical protein
MPAAFWVEALHAACLLINRLPCTRTPDSTPYTILHNKQSSYDNLRVFGCLCYPNTMATSSHKLSPCSTACVFLGYPSMHKGYHCLDLSTRKIIISCHVVFDKTVFPFRFREDGDRCLDFLSSLLMTAIQQPLPPEPPRTVPPPGDGARPASAPHPVSALDPQDDTADPRPMLVPLSAPAPQPVPAAAASSGASAPRHPAPRAVLHRPPQDHVYVRHSRPPLAPSTSPTSPDAASAATLAGGVVAPAPATPAPASPPPPPP